MSDTSGGARRWLRPLTAQGTAAGADRFERGGYLVRPNLRLSQLIQRRPPGITTRQWNTALRTRFDFVAADARTAVPVFAVTLVDPAGGTAEQARAVRMTETVATALGLQLLRIESPVLTAANYARRITEYVIDARAFRSVALVPSVNPVAEMVEGPLSYREIIGRLPDGRSGFVNDLSTVARSVAVDAYASRQLSDPIIRGLHVCWQDGWAEGWAWVEVHNGHCLFEQVRLWEHQQTCAVDPGQLAEDLAAVAIGERLKSMETAQLPLHGRDQLSRALVALRSRRDEMVNGFRYDHVSF